MIKTESGSDQNNLDRALHSEALEVARRYRKNESELLDVICQIDERRLYLSYGYQSLYVYCTQALKLSEGTSYNLIGVSRKSRTVPELKLAVTSGEISLSQANKITSVITATNQEEWINQAKSLPRLALEKKVAGVNPKTLTPERATYVSEERVLLKLGVTEKLFKQIKRIQDLESKRQRKSVFIEDVLEVLIPDYLAKNDPLLKAEKIQERAEKIQEKAEKVQEKVEKVQEKAEKVQEKVEKKSRKGTRQYAGQNRRERAAEDRNDSSREESLRYSVNFDSDSESLWSGPSNEERRKIPFNRSPITANLKRQVILRDRDRCQKCSSTRFTERHHIIPISLGGHNELANLQTLCSGCHKLQHQ